MKEKYWIHLESDDVGQEEFEINDQNVMSARIQLPNGKIVEGSEYKVELSLSPDAMIGLGTYLLRKGLRSKELDKDLYKTEFEHLRPLDKDSAVTNMGVYLAPESTELMIGLHDFGTVENLINLLQTKKQ